MRESAKIKKSHPDLKEVK